MFLRIAGTRHDQRPFLGWADISGSHFGIGAPAERQSTAPHPAEANPYASARERQGVGPSSRIGDFCLRVCRGPSRLGASRFLQPASQANQPLPDPDPPPTLRRAVLVPLEPAPARESLIQHGKLAKLFPNPMLIEVIYHGHLLSGVPRPNTSILLVVVEFCCHAAGHSAAIGSGAYEVSKPRDGACAHPLSSALKAQCENKKP